MRRGLFLLISLCLLKLQVVYAQDQSNYVDSLRAIVETKPNELIKYWKKGYYDSIPKQEVRTRSNEADFEQMLRRYQSKDFEYIESISDKMSLVKVLYNRFKELVYSFLPKQNLQVSVWLLKLLGVLGGFLLLYTFYRYFIASKVFFAKNPKESKSVVDSIDYVEKNLMKLNVQTYIDTALQNADYALAIRYQQLLNIQKLQEKGYVLWDQAKTSIELIDQVDDEQLKKDYISCTRVYDYVWFGDFKINKEHYEVYRRAFEDFRRRWA